MAYKITDRMQSKLLPSTIDDYVGSEDPVRVYDALVNALDFNTIGIPLEFCKSGADEYYPKDLLKLIIYGYSYGVRSSRQLERACHHNLSFIWLMGGSTPDYRTIARFRKEHKDAIKNVLKQCVQMCLNLKLIAGHTLFIDGSGMRANASIKHSWDKKRCQEFLKKVDDDIEKLVEESERIDCEEGHQGSLVSVPKELRNRKQLKQRVEEILKTIEEKEQPAGKEQHISHNTVDEDCIRMQTRQGKHAGYNAQVVADEKYGLIVHSESTQISDYNQLNTQIEKASETLGKRPKIVSSDSGYYSIVHLAQINPEIQAVIPDRSQVHPNKESAYNHPFDRIKFKYDTAKDQYLCPAGKPLKRIAVDRLNHGIAYQANGQDCQSCHHFGVCTTACQGRKINRSNYEAVKERLRKIYDSAKGQFIYALRKQKAELPFGHFKRNLSAGQFLLRGKAGTNAELALLSTCFNIARMITIVGIPKLILKLAKI
ncbi:MAG: IS1182 family transposase [Smithella sp.]|nr:IS1182 family transposase [Smithella sp.]